MSLTDRDRKIVMLLIPVLLIVGYWFLLLSPKREAAATAADELAKQEERRDAAVAKRGQLQQAKSQFADDYHVIVRLGKALPATVDTPSLMLQLDRAARGTTIDFEKIKAGDRATAPGESGTPAGGSPTSTATAAASSASSQSTSSDSSGAAATPPAAPAGDAAAGGAAAQSAPGQATESAGNATESANTQSSESESSSAESSSGSTGVAPSGGESGGPPAGESKDSGVPGLDAVPLEFKFNGSFFDLAEFFHRVKRFVRMAQGDNVRVRGRLMTVDSFKLAPDEAHPWPALAAEMKATVYLSPKSQGVTAGATPDGPAGAPTGTPAAPSDSASSPPPTAAVTR